MKKNLLHFMLLFALIFTSCKKSTLVAVDDGAATPSTDTLYTSDHQKNLAIVYFIPSDLDTLPGWHKRLSGVFLHGQNYFKNNMQARGYGSKTFGLLKDTNLELIKIFVIKGKLPKESYPYDGGAAPARAEIEEYIAAHPNDFTSKHVMVMMPAHKYSADGNPGGVPFYGNGRWAFGLDYPDLDISNIGLTTPAAKRASGWIAANFHEMAHALNLPHDSEKVSDRTDPALGYALMGNGMREFVNNRSFLTEADCAILNVNEVFQTNSTIAYYQPVTASIKKIYVTYDAATGSIEAAGRFMSTVNVSNVIYYLDPNVGNEGVGTNNDYNAVTWRSNVIGTDSFKVSIPVNQLFYKGNYAYELKVKLVHENGTVTQTIYAFNFVNNVPVIRIFNEYEKTGWSVIAQSSQESSFPAANILDGKVSTYWRSKYTGGTPAILPHVARVDMTTALNIKGVSFAQRSDGLKTVKDFEIQFSNSPSTGFISAGTFTAANASGTQYFDLTMPVTARYFRLVIVSNHDGTNDSGIGEVGMY